MPTLALSMIVKNAEATLSRCLESVRGVVDEIVTADTGSTDNSRKIAREHGARVFRIPWERDFAKARNLSLAKVRSDWVLILDADEALDPAAKELIPPLLAHPTVMGYMVQIRNYLLELNCHLWDQSAKPNVSAPPFARGYPAYVQHENVRLFRRHPDVYFVGRVHETVGCRILEQGMKIGPANFLIHHMGFIADDQTLARKWEFYRELGREKLRDRPDDANAYFELGIEEFDHFHNNDKAVKLFAHACELNPRLGVAWVFHGLALARGGKHREALESFGHAEVTRGRMEVVHESKADSFYSLGEFDLARESYEQALRLLGDAPQIESKLGFTEVRLGMVEEGLARLRRAVDLEPQAGELHDRLIAACAWLGRVPEAADAATAKLARTNPQPEDFVRAASLRAQLQDWHYVRKLLSRGLGRFPESGKLQEALAETEREVIIAETEAKGDQEYRQSNFESACRFYENALARLGNSPHIASKLGLAEVRLGRAQEGLARLRRAVEQGQESAEVYDRMVGAFILLGRLDDAAQVAEKKLCKIGPQPDSYLRAAALRAQLCHWPQVITLLRQGLDHFPDAIKLQSALAEVETHLADGSLPGSGECLVSEEAAGTGPTGRQNAL